METTEHHRLLPSSCGHKNTDRLKDIATRLNTLGAYLQYAVGDPQDLPYEVTWIEETDFSQLDTPTQQRLLAQLGKSEFGTSAKASSASLLLRYGWSAGFLIGAWMTSGIVVRGAIQSLAFNPSKTLLSGVCIRDCSGFLSPSDSPIAVRRQQLITELTLHARAVVEAHHRWSGFSRKALWSMVTSSWAAQFATVGEKLGRPEYAISETRKLLALDPDTAASQPELYLVEAGEKIGLCQKRKLCCLWYKSPKGGFCCSCPILPDTERLIRNRDWIQQYGIHKSDTTSH
ncbi:hypothetical protein ACXIUT_29790 [Achromobacter denitrificans]